jgi:hypothetical protein
MSKKDWKAEYMKLRDYHQALAKMNQPSPEAAGWPDVFAQDRRFEKFYGDESRVVPYEDTDGRTDIVLHLEPAEVYQLMLAAHERDITLNQLVEDILRQFIEEHKE